jgi:hypothetical protein
VISRAPIIVAKTVAKRRSTVTGFLLLFITLLIIRLILTYPIGGRGMRRSTGGMKKGLCGSAWYQ